MQKTPGIRLDFNGYSDNDLEAKALEIYAAMNSNPDFPSPNPTLASLMAATNTFANAISAAKTRDKLKIIDRNNAREALVSLIKDLGSYVNYAAKDYRSKAGSGFSLSSISTAPKPLGTPENFAVEVGKTAGEATISLEKVKNARGGYMFFYGKAPITNDLWQHTANSKPFATVSDLQGGVLYSFKVGVIGSHGHTVYTDIITKMVV